VVLDYGDSVDSVFIATTNTEMTGCVGFKNCIFNNCTFKHVGIIATPDVIAILKSKVHIIQ
jgi:hypothetical protein